MRVYISGAITDVDDYKEHFDRAERQLKAKGYEVFNPTVFDDKLPQLTYEEYMKLDLALLDMCEVIYMLEGWKKSFGANREYGYALAKGLKIVEEI